MPLQVHWQRRCQGGNVATGAAAGAGSEWLNTYVTDYLNEHTKDLKLDAGQKEKLKQAAQQMPPQIARVS